ncbi:MAG: PilZ domain-containing protein [Phycisphaerae bacterium]|nr:PilZ domain-containing protein [Phycisphaerae bacterium]
MSVMSILAAEACDAALEQALARGEPVVLSLERSDAWLVAKSRFLGAASPGHQLLVQYPDASEGDGQRPEIQTGENIGVAFRRGHKKCVFTAIVLATGHYTPSDGEPIESLALSWPAEVQELQRRAYYRVPVPGNRFVPVKFWEGSANRQDGPGRRWAPTHTGQLADISVGGMRVVLPAAQNPRLHEGDAVGIEFQPDINQPPFVLDTQFRYANETPDSQISIGLQFVGLETSPQGQELLHRLFRVVRRYQQYEQRQTRIRKRRR